MQVIVHRGTHEIGGSCVEVCHGDTRIIIDIGMPLNTPKFNHTNNDDSTCVTGQRLHEQGILPNIKGLFPWDNRLPTVDALLLSHAHQDHYDVS